MRQNPRSSLLGTAQGLSVYVDGVRVNESFGDTVNWDLIPDSAIAGIDLIPGSNPAFVLNTLGGALAENPFVGGSIQLDPDDWRRETFIAPGAQRFAWLGVRYVFGDK